jgi:hypothetical protein
MVSFSNTDEVPYGRADWPAASIDNAARMPLAGYKVDTAIGKFFQTKVVMFLPRIAVVNKVRFISAWRSSPRVLSVFRIEVGRSKISFRSFPEQSVRGLGNFSANRKAFPQSSHKMYAGFKDQDGNFPIFLTLLLYAKCT